MSDGIPLILPALVILGVCAVEWRFTRPVAVAALACGFVLAVIAFRWPGLGASAILAGADTPVAVALGAARLAGCGCFLWSVVRLLRKHEVPW